MRFRLAITSSPNMVIAAAARVGHYDQRHLPVSDRRFNRCRVSNTSRPKRFVHFSSYYLYRHPARVKFNETLLALDDLSVALPGRAHHP